MSPRLVFHDWGKYEWDLAPQDCAAYTGQIYSSAYEFIDTVMYLSMNHEVAPKEEALGEGDNCGDCHINGQVDWVALGYADNRFLGHHTLT